MNHYFLLIAMFVIAIPCSAQQSWPSLHQAPAGTEVEGSFVLARKVVPLPAGKFKLVIGWVQETVPLPTGSALAHTSPVANVILVQTQGAKLRIGLWARANIHIGGTRWDAEPCKRSDTLFKLDRTKSFSYRHDCVMVNHVVGWMTNPTGSWVAAYDALKSQGINVPITMVLRAEVTRIENFQLLGLTFVVDPEVYGFSPGATATWNTSQWHKSRIEADPRKVAFVKAFSDWVVALKPVVDQGFDEQAFPSSAVPALHLPALVVAAPAQQRLETNTMTPSIPIRPLENNRLSLEASKKECAELGFKSGTEDYGKCVLQLSR